MLPSTEEMSTDDRLRITAHFDMRCAGCREDGPALMISPLLGGHVVLCRFCRENPIVIDEEVVLQADPTP
jgi:hypothetical protein